MAGADRQTRLMVCNVGSPHFNGFSTTNVEIVARPAACTQVGSNLCTSVSGDREMTKFLKLLKNIEGATAIEYGLIAALIAVAAIGAMQGIGNKLNTTFNNVSNSLG